MGMAGEARALHLGRSGVLAFLVPLEVCREGETSLIKNWEIISPMPFMAHRWEC
jgi:hypothetical protein